MNKQESLLLSDEAMMDAIRKHHLLHSDAVVYITDDDRAVAKAQAKYTLEQLEKEGNIAHEKFVNEIIGDGEPYSELVCKPDCWLCAALREVRA